jgi:hypothetical protein
MPPSRSSAQIENCSALESNAQPCIFDTCRELTNETIHASRAGCRGAYRVGQVTTCDAMINVENDVALEVL